MRAFAILLATGLLAWGAAQPPPSRDEPGSVKSQPENPGQKPKGKALTKCGVLGSGTYYLANDVSSPGTCFSVQGNGATLDLNGHTITYAESESGQVRYGVLGVICWDPHKEGNPCGKGFDNLTIRNGKIVQGPAAGDRSHAIRVGQGGGKNLTVENVEITVSAPSSVAIYSTYAGGGARILNNVIHSNVQVIRNRHQLEGVSIKLTNDGGAKKPSTVAGNKIIGGVQGGIEVTAPQSKVHDNDISQDGKYTNDFCIYALAGRIEVFNNNCHPKAGRGIMISSTGVQVYNNTIEVTELARNQEYKGCQIGGSYGIQLRAGTTRARVYGNKVIARAIECDASAFRATEVREGAGNLVYENTFVAVREGGSRKGAFGVSFQGVTGGVRLERNAFTSDTAGVMVAWEGASGIEFVENTFAAGKEPDNWVLVDFVNNKPSRLIFQDSSGEEKAGALPVKMRQLGAVEWAVQSEFLVQWSLNLEVRDATGKTLSGVSVVATDNRGSALPAVTTDASGKATLVVPAERYFNSQASGRNVESLTPYSLVVSKPGYASQTQLVEIHGRQTLQITLAPSAQ